MIQPETIEARNASHRIIPITNVDFSKPWSDIVSDINRELQANRYELFDPQIAVNVLLSDLNSPMPANMFDPVRVSYDILDEKFSAEQQAIAKLGLQMFYWQGLAEVLPNSLFYDKWSKFSVIPVFTKANTYYLKEKNDGKSVSDIQYGGDNDMISALSGRKVMTSLGGVTLDKLGVPGELAVTYLAIRNEIDEAENIAETNAIEEAKELPIWSTLRGLFPTIDKVFEHVVDFQFMYLRQARELVADTYFHGYMGPDDDDLVASFRQDTEVDLASLLHQTTRLLYGRSLMHDTRFHESIQELADTTSDLYRAALHTYYQENQ